MYILITKTSVHKYTSFWRCNLKLDITLYRIPVSSHICITIPRILLRFSPSWTGIAHLSPAKHPMMSVTPETEKQTHQRLRKITATTQINKYLKLAETSCRSTDCDVLSLSYIEIY
jgi:hypothetical protein